MRILLTGISGFVGSHLAEYLLAQGHEVYGIVRWRSKTENIDHIKDQLHLLNADIRDGYSLRAAFQEAKPEVLFHLAAQSFVKESWNSPLETLSTNILGTCNVLEAVRSECPDATVIVAGSSEEYGFVKPDETPIKETNPLRPMSPYGISKTGTDYLGRLYHMSYGMKVIVARPFNTTGPRRGEVFATSNFAKQIAEIEILGKEPVIKVGNLEALRDWTDVRDIVRAYYLAALGCECGEVYNICSGRTWQVGRMLEILLSMSDVHIAIQQDASRLRPSDVPILLGDATKFKLQTNWSPRISFEQTMSDLLDYWRAKTKAAIPLSVKPPVAPLRVPPEFQLASLTEEQRRGIVAWKQGWCYKIMVPSPKGVIVINTRKPLDGITYHTQSDSPGEQQEFYRWGRVQEEKALK